MKRFLGLLVATVLILSSVAFASPSGAGQKACAVRWGSLPKEAPTTLTGNDPTGDVVNVRTGRHLCYDRIVIDLDGTAPGYRVEYVPKLVQDGSGATVKVTGGAIIQIVVKAPAYNENGKATLNVKAVNAKDVSGYRTFRDVAFAGSFEGQTNIGVGVRARLPFRVFTLKGPGDGSRVVIDVAHKW